MWDHILWEIEHTTTGRSRVHGHSCYASAETLAEEIGSTERAVSDRQGKLSKAGWIRRDGRGWAMSWAVPFAPECRTQPRPRKHRSANGVAPECLPVSTAVLGEQHRGANELTNDLSKNEVIEPTDTARERDKTLTSPDIAHRDLKPDNPVPSPPDSHDQAQPVAPTANPPAPPSPSKPKTRRKRATPEQPSLPMQGADLPAEDKPKTPAELVHERMVQRQTEVRAALGMDPPGKSVLDAGRRAAINARIAEHSLEACYRAIDVDAFECRRQGRDGESWAYWNLDTPFRNAKNFEQRLGKWRADGSHAVWGVPKPASTGGDWGRGSGIGSKATHSAAAEKLRREDAAAGIVHEEPTYFDEDDYEASCPTH
jgi:hypothetical protein